MCFGTPSGIANTGSAAEHFSVRLRSGAYGAPARRFGIDEGDALNPVDLPTISGPASIDGGRFEDSTGDLAPCSASGFSGHGDAVRSTAVDVTAPPRSSSRLEARFRVAHRPWKDLDLRLRLTLSPRLISGALGTLQARRTAFSSEPVIDGPFAVHLYFRTNPRSARGPASRVPTIKGGRRIRIAGGTKPAIAGQTLRIRYARVRRNGRLSRLRHTMRVRVRGRGRFRAAWVPPGPGLYELWATYRGHKPGLFGDRTCPRSVRVTRHR
jgi:hypothetical protein